VEGIIGSCPRQPGGVSMACSCVSLHVKSPLREGVHTLGMRRGAEARPDFRGGGSRDYAGVLDAPCIVYVPPFVAMRRSLHAYSLSEGELTMQ